MVDELDRTSQTDEELMLAIQGGCNLSFETIYNRYKVAIFNYCYRLLKHRESAEDCAQTAFITLHQKASYYKPEAKFSSWFYTIAKNIAFEFLRKKKVRQAASLDAEIELSDSESATKLEEIIASDEPTPDKISENRELLEKLNEAILRLPEADRQIIALCDIEKMPYDEVAKIINCPSEAVRVKVYRARMKLAKLFGVEEDFFKG